MVGSVGLEAWVGRSRSVPPPPPPRRAMGARTEIESGRHPGTGPGTGPGTEPQPKDKQGGGTPEGQQKKIISEEIKRKMEANRLNAYFIRKAKAEAAAAAAAAG